MSKREDRNKYREKLCRIYYDKKSHCFWGPEQSGNYTSFTYESAVLRLRAAGFSSDAKRGEMSEVDHEINKIMYRYGTDFAGPLSGYQCGLHEMGNKQCLVTRSYTLIEPCPGETPLINHILTGLLGPEQAMRWRCWLKWGYEALASGQKNPGQVMILAGPTNCCKSFLANHVVTPVLGGRSSRCYRYISGNSQFNGDCAEAEVLLLDDELPSAKTEMRMGIGAMAKSIVASEIHSAHYKGRDAFSFQPFWRLMVTVNDEPQALLALPIIDESLRDKIIMLKGQRFEMPMPTGTPSQRLRFKDAIHAELPAFIDSLCNLDVPTEMSDQRFGVGAFQHPDLIDALNELSPEAKLLGLIDAVLFRGALGQPAELQPEFGPWAGTATDLENRLRSDKARGQEVGRLLCWGNACGTYLGKLQHSQPERVIYKRTAAVRSWVITPPPPVERPARAPRKARRTEIED